MKQVVFKGRMVLVLVHILLLQDYNLQAQENRIPVVPYPQEVLQGKDYFSPSGSSFSLRISGIEGNTSTIISDQLTTAFLKRFQMELNSGDQRNPTIWIGLPGADQQLDALVKKKDLEPGPDLGDEGYLLKIGKKNIYIVANSQAGAFYGVQSLKQLLRGYPEPEQVPVLTIRDWPAISFRCVMDDISRGSIPTNDYMKQQIRRYAEMKINNMSFYIEHVVRTEKYPDLAPSHGGISIEEFSELSEYAADYHIELVGNFQSLGHFEKILSLPQFRHLGATRRMIDPLNPASIDSLRVIFSKLARAFISPFFTPNCDEAWDLSRGALTEAADSLGPARIYADHVIRIDTILTGLGKRTIVWGDIILEYPEILEMLPKSMVLGAWDYSPSESFAEFIDPLKNAGFDFTISPGVLNSNRLIPDFRMTTTNIRNFINEGYEKGTMGVYFTVWDDGGMHFFSHDWYGVAYNAEQCWRPNRDPLEDFDYRFSRGIYGDQKNLIPGALHALNNLTDLGPTFEMNSNVFRKTLVPERGSRVTFDPGGWTGVERWASEARGILTAGYTPYYDPDLAFIKFTISQYEFMAHSRNELLKASDAYIRACDLQRLDRRGALDEVKEAYDIIGSLKYRFERLTADFEILWDMESRAHWKDRALQEYHKQEASFSDLWNLLGNAMEDFRAGHYLPPPAEVRLDIRRQPGQFFQFWLLAGSFSIATFEESASDFLTSMGGEAMARPFPGMRFKDEGGKDRMWIKYDSPKKGEVDFKTILDPHITAVAYAYCTIDSPDERQVTALLGSNDGATVYCNGEKLHHVHGKRSLIPDEDEIMLNLDEGRNHILIKVEQWKGGWGFAFRLKNVEVRNHKQKYYIQNN